MSDYIDSFVAIDLETTGLDPKRDKIIEIGAARYIKGKLTDSYKTFVNPGRQLDERIVTLTGINDSDLSNAPYIEEILDDVITFIGDNILLGHGVLFDFSFLKRAAINNKIPFEKKAIDTLHISRYFLADLPSRNLHKLCEHYNIEHNEHRALDDAVATADLYGYLVRDFFVPHKKEVFDPKPLIYKVKKEGPITKAQLERLTRLVEEHNLDLKCDIKRLTKNEASRIIDTLRSDGIF